MSNLANSLSIVIPAYNEESGIAQTLLSIPVAELKEQGRSVEVIVVDNNSTDKTGVCAAELGARVVQEQERGYGCAYKKGISEAQGDLVITADADGTYPLQDIVRLIKHFEQNDLDFLTTNRFAGNYLFLSTMPVLNRLGNMFLSFLCRLLFGIGLRDSQSGMWVFKRVLFDELLIKSPGMAFSQEIKLEAIYAKKCKWGEIDIEYCPRVGKKKLNLVRDGVSNVWWLFKKRIECRG